MKQPDLRLLLVRHGETAWNEEGKYIGITDLPLSPSGRRQASRLSIRLADEAFDHIYTSPLQRARQTAAAIAEAHDLSVQPDDRLRELDFGRWEGLTPTEIQQQDPELYARWQAGAATSTPGGERIEQLADRCRAFLEEVQSAYPLGTLLIISHGGPLQMMLLLALGIPERAGWIFHTYNGSRSELHYYDGEPALVHLNDTCHLAGVSAH